MSAAEIEILEKASRGFDWECLLSLVPAEIWTIAPKEAAIMALEKSGVCDCEDYLKRYPEAALAGFSAIEHFARYGAEEGRILNRLNPPERPAPGHPATRILRAGPVPGEYSFPLLVNWNLTNMCNYQCSYCITRAERPTRGNFPSWEKLTKAVGSLVELKRDLYTISLIGGEPTIVPRLYDLAESLVDRLDERINHIIITSNGSRQGRLYEKLAELANRTNLIIAISLHMEFADLGHIRELVETVSGKTTLSFHLMFHPEKRERVKESFALLRELRHKYPFTMDIALLATGDNFDRIDERYVPDDFDWRIRAGKEFEEASAASAAKFHWRSRVDKHLFWDYEQDGARKYDSRKGGMDRNALFMAGKFRFKDMWCVPGDMVLNITPSGVASGALCGMVPYKYNMYSENPYRHADFMNPAQCHAENCHCCGNDYLQKFASEEEARIYSALRTARQAELLNGYGR